MLTHVFILGGKMKVSERLTRFLSSGELPTPDTSPTSSPIKNTILPKQVKDKGTISNTIVSDISGPSETVFLPQSNYKSYLLGIVQKYDDSSAQANALELHQQHVILLKTLYDALRSKLEDYELDLVKYEESLNKQEQFLLSKTDFLDNYKVALQLKEKSLISKLKQMEQKDMELIHIDKSIEDGLKHVDVKFLAIYNDIVKPCQIHLNQMKDRIDSNDGDSWINNNRRVIKSRFPIEYAQYVTLINQIDDISDNITKL
ncbi:hypothetical protein DFJ63DRAFT_316023 [Scheffersomyces coipomensis]|uniref:uncharacterized protein n=1 Tax=Scheffersomyces coipomensis TaxID=1788519 RepID=UPI00315DBC86